MTVKLLTVTLVVTVLLFSCTGLKKLSNLKESGYLPRDYYAALLEPRQEIIHGAGQSAAAYQNYYKVMPNTAKPLIYMLYEGITDTNANNRLLEHLKQIKSQPGYTIPQIGLYMTTDGQPELCKAKEVAQGQHDSKIEAFCATLKDFNRPVYLRIGYEFNGHWNGYPPNDYKAAYIRVTNAIRKNGLNNVATVWCFAVDGKEDDFMKYYPGDAYTDWWGIDIFGETHFAQPETKAFLDSARAHKKPVMIGESTPRRVGTLGADSTWNRWFGPYFNLMKQNPGIKAFCYINWNWSETMWSDWGDARIETATFVKDKYLNELQTGPFMNSGPEKKVNSLLNFKPR
jgi:Glycosyl hydrolase family 26